MAGAIASGRLLIGVGSIEIMVPTGAMSKELARTKNFRPWAEAAVEHWRSIIADEFDAQAWQSKGGGLVPWERTKPFGNVEPPAMTLQRSGALRAAWLGGPGSVTRITDREAAFGVTGFPGLLARVHRGKGDIGASEARQPTIIPVTKRMRGYLAVVKEVRLRKETKVIRIPKRPHATTSPLLRTGLIQLARRYVLKGLLNAAA